MTILRSNTVAVAWLLCASLLASGCSREEPPPPPIGSYAGHNILVISVDTLRADRLGAYGYERPTSPQVETLAARGIVFERAFAPRAMTWPSLSTMLTSVSPGTSKVRWNGQYLPKGFPTLAGILQRVNYRAGAFTSGSICHFVGRTGTFDKVACGDDRYVTERTIAFLDSAGSQPFFAWLHLLAPHGPYAPPPEHDRFRSKTYEGPVGPEQFLLSSLITTQRELTKEDRAQLDGLYDGEVHFADSLVGLVLKALDERGLARSTIVVFTADHGEDLYDHNKYLYHSCSIYDSGLHIPLLLALPDAAGAGRRFAPVVEMEDVAPTLLELVGVAAPASFEGRSLVPRLNAGERLRDDDEHVSPSEWYDPAVGKSLQTVRSGRWRYVSNPDGVTPKCPPFGDYYKVAREELYDHESDPREQRNVAAEHPDLTARFAKLTAGARDVTADEQPLPVDPKLREELRSLGYIE